MAEPYLSQLDALVTAFQHRRGHEDSGLITRHFCSGAATYVDGQIFMTLTPVSLGLKLPEEDRRNLARRGARPLRYFPKAPVK